MTNSKNYLDKIVSVKIDRPLGSKHPKHGFIYPVNYGFIPNTISGDNEELDCYVLGIFEPVDSFSGRCIAIIHRINDNDMILIHSCYYYLYVLHLHQSFLNVHKV